MQASNRELSEYQSVGRYRIYGELAAGGMGVVHLGRLMGAAGFTRTVAIKRLHPHLANESHFVSMLIDEANVAASIRHPNVVSTIDVVYQNGELLLVMDYIEGETLAKLLAQCKHPDAATRPSWPLMVRVMVDVLLGLHAAHTARSGAGRPLQIVHRDVSPHNILVGTDGISRVLDFGVAKAERRRQTTQPGHVKGKFAYMAPEQIRGQTVDPRTDVFAAGIVLWESLTLRRLFRADTWSKTVERVLGAEVAPPSSVDPSLPPELDRIVLKALEQSPDRRFASARDFAMALASLNSQSRRATVGHWVTKTARQSLLERARRLQEVEASVVTQVASGKPFIETELAVPIRVPQTRPSDPASPVSVAPRTVSMVAPSNVRPAPAPEVELPADPSWLSRSASGPCPPKPTNGQLVAAFGAAVVLFMAVCAAFGVLRDGSSPRAELRGADSNANSRKTPGTPNTVVDPSALLLASAGGTAGPEASEASSGLPVLSVESIPSQRPPMGRAPSSRPRGGLEKLRASSRAKVTPSATASSVTPPAAPASAAVVHPPCEPPFRIDEAGIRRIKKECL